MARYPGEIRTWTTKRDFSQTIIESHMNDIQDEAVAGETVFGVNPHIATKNPGFKTRDYGTVTDRITSMVRGEQMPYYQAALIGYPLHPTSIESKPDVPSQDPDGRDLDWCGRGRRQRAKVLTLATGERLYMPYHYKVPNRDGEDEPWLGLPLEQDDYTIADGGWQRLPLIGQDDPFSLGIGDGIRLIDTGLWMISLKVDYTPTEDSITVRARYRARLEIDGKARTLQHLVRSNAYNEHYLTSWIHWVEVMPKGTVITASARVDGTDLEDDILANAYLRAHLIRCTEGDDDGFLVDFPDTIYKPPPPPPPPRPTVPYTPSTPNENPYVPPTVLQPSSGYQSSGPYVIEARPGEWYGIYGWGTVGPNSSPIFPGTGLIEAVYN